MSTRKEPLPPRKLRETPATPVEPDSRQVRDTKDDRTHKPDVRTNEQHGMPRIPVERQSSEVAEHFVYETGAREMKSASPDQLHPDFEENAADNKKLVGMGLTAKPHNGVGTHTTDRQNSASAVDVTVERFIGEAWQPEGKERSHLCEGEPDPQEDRRL